MSVASGWCAQVCAIAKNILPVRVAACECMQQHEVLIMVTFYRTPHSAAKYAAIDLMVCSLPSFSTSDAVWVPAWQWQTAWIVWGNSLFAAINLLYTNKKQFAFECMSTKGIVFVQYTSSIRSSWFTYIAVKAPLGKAWPQALEENQPLHQP